MKSFQDDSVAVVGTDAGRAPLRLGKYHAIALVGRGGMANVHLAVAGGVAGFSKLLVVKTLRAELAMDPDIVAMFLDEARLAARLEHPNIVHTFEFAEEGGTYYLAMEHLDGQPLDRVIARVGRASALEPAIALSIIRDVLAALHHAHGLAAHDGTPLSVVHRDVSPQNVFITYSGLVKLVDFGIAKVDDGSVETRIGTFKGKVAYMAPEQALGDHVDRRADVFACGVVLHELLTGTRFWGGLTEAVIASKLASCELPRVESALSSLAPEIRAIVARATAPDRDARYASAEAMLSDVEAALGAHGARQLSRELARLVSEAFAAERIELDRFITTQLVKHERGERLSPRTSLAGVTFGTPTQESDLAHTRVAKMHAHDPTSVDTVPGGRIGARSAAKRLAWPRYAAVCALAVGVSLGVVLTREDTAPPSVAHAGALPVLAVTEGGCATADAPAVRISGDIDEDATLTCDRVYRLEHTVFVRPGVTLTIAPGTRIVGDAESDGTLVVEPGGKLHAEGTRNAPIVFTSERADAERRPGDWGGVILLGNAPTNLRTRAGVPRRGQVEGILERGGFGGESSDDSSGVLRYVRIEFGGTRLGPNNEINGLTLAGVGRGTRIDHVQVRHTKDDCFEFFGGTVTAHHLICDAPGDDGFDWDNGYTGRLQFLYLRDDASGDGNNGFEGDNDAEGSPSAPVSAPTASNITLCGAGPRSDSYAIMLRRGTRGTIVNLVASGFRALVDVRDRFMEPDLRAFAVVGGALPVALVEGDESGMPTNDDHGFDELAWLADRVSTAPSSTTACGHDALPSGSASDAFALPDDGFFDTTASYLGAFVDTDRWDLEPWVAPFP